MRPFLFRQAAAAERGFWEWGKRGIIGERRVCMLETIWEAVKELCGIGYAKIVGFLRAAWGKLLAYIPAVAHKKGEAAIIEAEAAVEVKKTEARGIIEVDDMLRRHGLLAEWQQGNINNITRKADGMKQPGDAQKFHNINKEWAADYIEKSKNCSNEEMQDILAKILVGEATKPGSFSKKTVAIVSEMDKEDAELFVAFCQFVWKEGSRGGPYPFPMILDVRHEIYMSKGIDHDALANLEAAGLIVYDMSGMSNRYSSFHGTVGWHYFDSFVGLTPEKRGDGYHVDFGVASLTKYGEQLLPVCSSLGKVRKNIPFYDYIIDQWKEKGYNPSVAAVLKTKEELLG